MTKTKDYSKQLANLAWELEQLAHGLKDNGLKASLWSLAEKAFNTILEKEPDNPNVLHGLGTLFLHQGKYKLAENYYQKALDFAKSPQQKARFYNSLGNVYFQKKNPQKALELYQKALPNIHYKTLVLANLAFTYQSLGHPEKTREYAQKALQELKKERRLKHSQEPARSLKKLLQTA